MSSDPQLGAIVEINVGRGVVRFYGATSFAAGKWVGIELNEANGKNNGIINGITYFTCQPNYGVFVRPSQVKVIGSERDLPSNNVRHKICEGEAILTLYDSGHLPPRNRQRDIHALQVQVLPVIPLFEQQPRIRHVLPVQSNRVRTQVPVLLQPPQHPLKHTEQPHRPKAGHR
jgi:hypothetical protein